MTANEITTNSNWKNFWSPALRIAGGRALIWGLAGLAATAAAGYSSGTHAHGLMNYGPAQNNAAWIFVVEYLMIWLIPAAIFYGFGSVLSHSRIRAVDVFGTTVFALLPLAVTNLTLLLPGFSDILATLEEPLIDISRLMGIVMQPMFWVYIIVLMAAFILMLVWLFNAVRVSCNLRGGRLWAVYLVGLIGGDIICKLLLRLIV
jgi:hypothetical protein